MNLWESFIPNLQKHFDILEEFYAQNFLDVLNFEHIILLISRTLCVLDFQEHLSNFSEVWHMNKCVQNSA